MLWAPQTSDKRLKSTSYMQCNGLVRSTDSRLLEGQLVHRPVCVSPDNRDTKFWAFPLGHCSDWKVARYSSSIQEVNRTSYWTSGAAAAVTVGFELLSPQPTTVHWLDQPNEKNMQDQDIPLKPLLPNGGNTLGQHRHRKKVRNSLTACPTCHVAASTSSGPVTAPLISDSDILHDDDEGKPLPKSSSKKRRNKSKQLRRATRGTLNLSPELLREEQIDAASPPAEVLLPDSLADKLSDTSSSASSLVKDVHLGKDNGESNNGFAECGTVLTSSTLESDGPGCTGSCNITAGERVCCKGDVPSLNDGPNPADSSELGGSALAEHDVGEESNSCQKSFCACVFNSNGATADSLFKLRNSDSCGDCSTDIEGRLTIKNENEGDVRLGGTHAGDAATDSCSHAERVQCSSEACSSKMFLPVSSGRRGRRSRETSGCNNSTATHRVVGANRQRRSGKDGAVSVWQKVEKLNKEKPSGAAGHAAVSSGVEHHANRPTGKHRCKKSCKHHSSRNCYAPKNHLQQEEGLSSMLQLACARDASDRRSGAAVTEEASLARYDLDSHSVPQGTSEQACTLVIRDGTHSLCVENEAIPTDLDPRNLCADPCVAELEENQGVKSYSAAAHMSHKWVPVRKKDIVHLDVPEASVIEASVPANDVSVYANIDVQRNVSDFPASTKREGSEVFSTEATAKLNASAQPYSKCQGHIETGTAFSKIITEAVSDAYRAQRRAEDIQLLTGRPLADFEQLIYSASPVLHCTPCPTGCNSSSQESVRDRLCSHQTADICLSSIWQWYEEPGCYGLEVKAQDLRRSNGSWNSHCQFNAYFVPYLSAVQLFGQPKRITGKDAAGTGGARSKTSPCLSSFPILAKLLPKESSDQRNTTSALDTKDDQQSETMELLFEFFESEQPFWRRQLFDKVKELFDGARQSNCHISGDPKNLELNLHDLHPASWYCVAWYPIYRIPDGKFQAAFLTYHSLGHWVHPRGCSSDQAGDSRVVLPVMGLQSYNDKGEWWFQTSTSDGPEDATESVGSLANSPSQVLRERVSTLKQAAAAMARADVLRKDQTRSRNRHPDYEFFLSRYR